MFDASRDLSSAVPMISGLLTLWIMPMRSTHLALVHDWPCSTSMFTAAFLTAASLSVCIDENVLITRSSSASCSRKKLYINISTFLADVNISSRRQHLQQTSTSPADVTITSRRQHLQQTSTSPADVTITSRRHTNVYNLPRTESC